MKHLYLLFILLLPGLAHAQLRDDFTDGNFTANPAWTGDAASFQVVAQQLQSNGPAVTGTALQLSTPSQASTGTVWEFWANLRFATSSGNLADVWLMASQADLRNANNSGYFVRLGGTADEVSLFRKDSTRAAALVIDGLDGTLASATNNLVRVRVTRTTANRWTLERDLTGGRAFVAEAAQPTDATYQRSAALGVSLLYSSANGARFTFDDFAATDATAPLLLRAVPLDARRVDAAFNEAVAPASATVLANYRLQSGAAPTSAQVLPANPAVVRLTFGADVAAQNVLEVRSVADLYGNVAAGPLTATFTGPPAAPLVGELVITEIFADETPPVGLPLSEYLELYNRSATKTLSLGGVRLGKTGSTAVAVFPDTARLLPGQYAVVCGSTRVAQFAAPGVKVYGPTNFPSLSNGGDQLLLRGRDGRTLFEVNYSDTWYRSAAKKDGGWSLEMIDTNNYCAGAPNWTASTDATGGTPGRANAGRAANADTAPPALARAELLGPTTLRLTFSEKLDSTNAANPARYALAAPAPAITAVTPVGPDFRQVDLTLAAPVAGTAIVQVTVQTATDCAGNVSGALQTATAAPPEAPAVGELVITEIFADETPTVGLPAFEYLELYNRSATKTLSLRGVRLGKGSTPTVAVFADTARLAPGQYAVVCGSTHVAEFASYGKVYGPTNFPSLSNGGDQLILRGRDGRTLFEVNYSDAWYRDAKKKDGGWSLEMIDASNYCTGAANWIASTDASGGTPGRANAGRAANADALAPGLLRAVAVNPTTVRLYFSEKLDSAAAATPSRYALAAPGPAVTRAAPVAPDFRQVDLTLAAPLLASRPASLTVQTATDCAGNASGALQSASFALPEPAASGDVVLNELLFNPRTSAVRFVEILNRSPKYIDLQAWQIANEKPDGTTDANLLSPGPLVLAPGQLLAFSTSSAIIQSEYPTSTDPANLLELADFPTFPDDAGVAVLLTGFGIEIDRFAYNKNLHLSLLATQDGVSLERIRANGPSNGSNFHSAAGTVGYATPGRPNSQAQDAPGGNQELTVEPEIFTPDDDGQQDFATLNYHLDQPGYAASVTVYDALGRLTRRLVRNETLPTTGFLQWDGTDDKGRKAAVGYYLLHVELFRASGGEKREYKKTVVLGARF
ncbi:lamin tail domain-containing protein [Hymenobacter sp.]|uniref:lamin tail domain-containing protein n=1 Tax=Hymenobacter sp. TaxID=1898978 RepID=UPI00286AFFE1|nr:lamin tail domain-containing protein [Hymenobacter sp.]